MKKFEYNTYEDQFIELESFSEWLSELEKIHNSQVENFIIDINRINKFKKRLFDTLKFIRNADPDVYIHCVGLDGLNHIVEKKGEIQVVTTENCIKNIKYFVELIKYSSYVAFLPDEEDKIKIFIGFYDVLKG
ncbi:MAG: hypothetical protein FWD71_05245 [Oscillospiraceae bacterium]|nr:hypothetical protein [Oscillospiraceae bacterium]